MGTIFGSNEGRLFKQGDTSFWEQHSGKDDIIYHSGNMAFGGENMYTDRNISFFNNCRIFGTGNTFECGRKRYTKVGNTLWGPDGKRWYGDDMSDCDIRDIISHDD